MPKKLRRDFPKFENPVVCLTYGFIYSSSGSSNKSSKETSSKNGNGKPNGHVEHDSKSGSSTKPATPALVKIYVSGITDETKASDLHDAFSKHATVSDAKIIRFSKIPNQCFGLITVENDQQYTKCFENLNKTNFNGNTITLSRVSSSNFSPLGNVWNNPYICVRFVPRTLR